MPDSVTKAFTLLTTVMAVICLSRYLEIPPLDVFEFMAEIRSVSFQARLNIDLTLEIQI